MSLYIPESLLNVLALASCDIALASIAIPFQITVMTLDTYNVQVGGGIWCGSIFALTAVMAIKAHSKDGIGNAVVVPLVLSPLSFVCGILLLAVNAASVDRIHRYRNYICDPNTSTCSLVLVLETVLIICGLIAILVNAFLTLAIVRIYRPPPTIMTESMVRSMPPQDLPTVAIQPTDPTTSTATLSLDATLSVSSEA